MADEVQGKAAGRALATVSQVRTLMRAMPAHRRRGLMIAALMIGALAGGMLWLAGRTDWRVVFSGLEARDVQTVSQELGAAGIRFQITSDGGGIEVPAELLEKARMEVAAKGMPQTGRLGFELFDKPNWVGSEFDERVNYQRALEGELEHTISTLSAVRSARVHLALPQQSLFAGEEKQAKASVVLKLKHPSMPAEQSESIRNLVAGAVENLGVEEVTLVDADGRVNLQRRGGSGPQFGDAEQLMEAKLVAMLEPLAGAGNVRATVNMTYEEASEDRTDEVYDPAQTAVTSMQKSEQTNGQTSRASGVPGTASNSPAAAPEGAVQGSAEAAAPGTPPLLQAKALPVYPSSGGQTQSTKQEAGTYAVTRHLDHVQAGPGRLRRVTAAVVVNDRQTVEGSGAQSHQAWKPRTTGEMHRLEELAQAAVGFDAKRGDQVVMQNVTFSANTPELASTGLARVIEQARGMAAIQPALVRTLMIGLLGALVVWVVLRPVARQVVIVMKESVAVGAGQAVGALPAADNAARLTDPRADSVASGLTSGVAAGVASDKSVGFAAGPAMQPFQRDSVFQDVADHIRRQPEQSTRLLETWIGAAGEAGS